ncbi:MAG: prolyl oligopeptidase family serine peptidase, partial [Alphaproteobacteria bacterium]
MNINRRSLLISAAATAVAGAVPRLAFAAAADGPPVARIEPVSETLFGVTWTDPYRWMENPNDKDWLPFMKGQSEYTDRVLAKIPGRDALRKRVAELSGDLEVLGAVSVGGPYTFIQKRPAGANNYQIYVREGNGALRLLIDPEARTKGDVHYAISYWASSPDGKYVAYGMSPSGSEDAVMEIIETATGKVLPERIDRTENGSPSWLPDGKSFFYNRLAETGKKGTTDRFKNSVAWLHKVGTDPKKDVKVLGHDMFPDVPVKDIDFPIVFSQTNSKYVIGALFAGVQPELELFVNTIEAAAKGKGGWKRICSAADKITNLTLSGDDIYLLTYAGAPHYKLLHVKADNPAVANAKEVVPESKSVIQNVYAAKDGVYMQALDGGVGRVFKLGADGKVGEIALPFEGSVGSGYADVDHDGMWAEIQSWVIPAQLVQIDAAGKVTDTGLIAKPTMDISPYESTRIFATAKDGTKVPISVVYRKGFKKNGKAPALVFAYGAYGITQDPTFAPRYITLLEQGGVWAIAGLRGGGEYGRDWYEAGKGPTKPNTWNDLIACCEKLIADGWTSKKTISIDGGSAGGIPMGRCLTERPDLFAVVFDQVPASNMLRMEFGQNGPPNIPEFGTVKTEAGFKQLYEMDSYVHIKDGTRYPAVMLTTGIQDPRVDPWQAAKMAARLQKANASGKPILLRIDFEAGHGI